MSTWTWISGARKRELFGLYLKHVREVERVIEKARDVIGELVRGSEETVAILWNDVFESERRADEIKRKILHELASEVFHPIDREEIVRLVLTTDDVAAYAKAWSRRAVLYLPERLPKDIGDTLYMMASKVLEAVKLLGQAAELMPSKPREVLEIANKVESIEEEIDDIRHEVFKNILKFCETSKVSECLLLKEIMDSVENASDRCEDVADVLRGIALLSI